MCKKQSYVAIAAIAVAAVVTMLFFPMMGTAGSLEPTAAPDSTMKTLDQIPPTWSQKLPSAQRFELVLDNAAVLDKETGLVWEKSPAATTIIWDGAMDTCRHMSVGNRKGWRLPTVEELESLVDPQANNPALPLGHPFNNVQSVRYWSATTVFSDTTVAYIVNLNNGIPGGQSKNIVYNMWCVRGGQGYDAY